MKQTTKLLLIFSSIMLSVFLLSQTTDARFVQPEQIDLPTGFAITEIVTGLSRPTDMALLPSGDILVAEKGGDTREGGLAKIKLVRDGILQTTSVVEVGIIAHHDGGVTGIITDPNFTENNYFYIWYTTGPTSIAWSGETKSRLSRFTLDIESGTADPASEQIIIDNLPAGKSHNGGGMSFGRDGYFYIGVGDTDIPVEVNEALDLSSGAGKILRVQITETGYNVPEDNPYVGVEGVMPEVYGYGLRNPFRMTMRTTDGELFFAEVGGGAWEEINQVLPTANYGWPEREGPCRRNQRLTCTLADPEEGYTDPVATYVHIDETESGTGGAITSLLYYDNDDFPAQYRDRFFYADYDESIIGIANITQHITGTTFTLEEFSHNIGAIVDMEQADSGFYMLDVISGRIQLVHYTDSNNQVPVAQFSADKQVGPAPLTVNFSAEGTIDNDDVLLEYIWSFGDGTLPITTNTPTISHTYAEDGFYDAELQVIDVRGGASEIRRLSISVYSGEVPTLLLENLTDPTRTNFYSGDRIRYYVERSTTDDLDNTTPYTWHIDQHHNRHTHPILADIESEEGIFTIPTDNHGGDWNIWYRFYLTMNIADGNQVTVHTDINPSLVRLHFESMPAPDVIYVDEVARPSGSSFIAVVGTSYLLQAPEQISYGSFAGDFAFWHVERVINPVNAAMIEPGIVYESNFNMRVPVTDTAFIANYRISEPTATLTPTDTLIPTSTSTPTLMPTSTPTPNSTKVAINTATSTATMSTAIATETSSPSLTSTTTPAHTDTPSPTSTFTPVLQPGVEASTTPIPTESPTPIDTATEVTTATVQPSVTMIASVTPIGTASPVATEAVATPNAVATETVTEIVTETVTPQPSATATKAIIMPTISDSDSQEVGVPILTSTLTSTPTAIPSSEVIEIDDDLLQATVTATTSPVDIQTTETNVPTSTPMAISDTPTAIDSIPLYHIYFPIIGR